MRLKRVSAGDRGRLKKTSKDIYRLMVMDSEAPLVNLVQLRVLVLLVILLAVSFAAIATLLNFPEGAARLAAFLDDSGVANISGEQLTVVAGLAVTLIAVIFLLANLRAITKLTSSLAGDAIVQGRKLAPRGKGATTSIEDVRYWFLNDPHKIATLVRETKAKECHSLLPKHVADALGKLAAGEIATGYVLAPGLFERKYAFLYAFWGWRTPRPTRLDREYKSGGSKDPHVNYFINARALRNAIKMAICFEALDVELRDETRGEMRWMWDYYTRHDYQQVPMWDEHDMPLRFRTASPHLTWSNPSKSTSEGEAPLFRAFSGLENPQNLPLELLCVRDVIAAMPEAAGDINPEAYSTEAERRAAAARALCLLATRAIKMISRRDFRTMRPILGQNAQDEPLCKRMDGRPVSLERHDVDEILSADWGVRWDPARIDWSSVSGSADTEMLEALAIFNDAINVCMRQRAHGALHSIVLSRGDVLFIDNMRCLAARFEHDVTLKMAAKRLFLLQPAEWWVRRFYGFRKSHQVKVDAHEAREEFRSEGNIAEELLSRDATNAFARHIQSADA
jgi:hypothetical protein